MRAAWLGLAAVVWFACLPLDAGTSLCPGASGGILPRSPSREFRGSMASRDPRGGDPGAGGGHLGRLVRGGGAGELGLKEGVAWASLGWRGPVLGGGGLRLRGGMGRKVSLADKIYKKRKQIMDDDDGIADKAKDAEDEEIAEEYRGLPLEERMKIAFDGQDVEEDDDGDVELVSAGREVKGEESGVDEEVESKDSDDRRPTAQVQRKFDQMAMPGEEDTDDSDAIELPDGKMEGTRKAYIGERSLRTTPCTGDAWPGLFVDLEAKEKDIEIVAVCLASANYRIEPHVNVKVWTSNGTSVGKEGDPSLWQCVFFAPNCTLPKVKRNEDVTEADSPYAQIPFAQPLRIPAGRGGCIALYTNSLCGLALRGTSNQYMTEEATENEKDLLGRLIGNATVPIVQNAQQERRADKRPVKIGEITDSDQYVRIRAGYCSPITGWDHPFAEDLIEREDEHVHAFVGEIVYNVV